VQVGRVSCGWSADGKRRQLGAQCPKLRRKNGAWSSTHGTWWYRFRPRPGEKPIRDGGFESRDEAEKARDEARERVKRGASGGRCPRVDVYLPEWVDGKADLAESTRRSYGAHIRNHLAPPLGHLRLDELRVGHVAEALAVVEGTDATRQRVRATLRSALNDAIREGLIVVNPAALVRLPAGKRPKALVWTVERVQRWAAAVERLEGLEIDDPAREQLEASAQPPSPVMVWTPAQLGRFLDAVQGTGCMRCGTSSRTAGSAAARCAGSSGRTSTSTPARCTSAASSCSLAGMSPSRRRSLTPAGARSPSTLALWPHCGLTGARRLLIGSPGVRRGRRPATCSCVRTAPRCTRAP
jgi:hypothetical protein